MIAVKERLLLVMMFVAANSVHSKLALQLPPTITRFIALRCLLPT